MNFLQSEAIFWNDYYLLWQGQHLGNFYYFDKKYAWMIENTDYEMFITINRFGEIVIE